MVFEHIEKLKRDYTDQYVVVDATRPELARFNGYTGRVKTVNMSGRALVEFDDYLANIGWYDIGLDFLKVVPKPAPKPKKEEKPATKPQVAAKPQAEAVAKPAAKPAGKPSTADILAAARVKVGTGEPVKPAPAAKPAQSKPVDKPTGGKLSTKDILAMARGGAAAKPPAAVQPQAAAPVVEEQPAAEPEVAEELPVEVPVAKPKTAVGDLPKTTAEKIAWCRAHDGKQ